MGAFQHTEDLSPQGLAQFDAIIDVRSPGEYAEDHLPGAINLPVLDDAERAEVGTIYKQVSPFEARRRGAALVSRNIGRHLDAALSAKARDFRPLLYCWRGGMRSRSMAVVFSEIGWRTTLVEGGYRTWRREVASQLGEEERGRFPLIVLDGQTGSAKTQILHAMTRLGAQVIDIEGLAAHRGSIFGALPDRDQPSQKGFESALWDGLRRFDFTKPVFVEAESSRIGRRKLPARLWASMKAAPRIAIAAPAKARAAHLLATYPDMAGDADRLNTAIDGLTRWHAKSDIEQWRDWAAGGDFAALALALIEAHYDPAYDRARRRHGQPLAATIETDRLDGDAIDALAAEVIGAAETIPVGAPR